MDQKNTIDSFTLSRDGRSQDDRHIQERSPAHVEIDGRSTLDMLNFVYEFSRQLNYFDSELNRQGDWSDFFRKSEPIQLARIAKLDIAAIETDYAQVADNFHFGLERGDPSYLFNRQIALANQVNEWYTFLHGEPSGYGAVLENLIKTNLSFVLRRVLALSVSAPAVEAGYQLYEKSIADLRRYDVWGLKGSIQPESFDRASRDTMRRELSARLDKTFQVLVGGMRELVSSAKVFFAKSLSLEEPENILLPAGSTEFQAHPPHLGLLYSFLRLYRDVQGDLNGLSKKHLDFYYERVLQLAASAAVPDQVHLVLEVADPLPDYVVPAGTRASAGEDDSGVLQVFELEDELFLQRARVAQLRTLFLDRVTTRQLRGGELETVHLSQALYAAPMANSADGRGTSFEGVDTQSWPTLGSRLSRLPDVDRPGELVMHPTARLGLALANRILLLREGQRNLKIEISCHFPDYLSTDRGLQRLRRAIRTRFRFTERTEAGLLAAGFTTHDVRRLRESYESAPKLDADFRAFLDTAILLPDQRLEVERHIERTLPFRVALSGSEGWFYPFEVTMDLVQKGGSNQLELNVGLGPEDPPITGFDPLVYGFDFGTDLPVLTLELNPDTHFRVDTVGSDGNTTTESVSLYEAFKVAGIDDVSMTVEVAGVRDLIVQNNEGPQDPGSPFPPFGVQPQSGGEFLIGSSEAFHKKLESVEDGTPGLRVHVEWDSLPASFFEHYRLYGATVLRPDFTATLSLRNQGAWLPLDENDPKENDPNKEDQQNKQLFTGLKATFPEENGTYTFEVKRGSEMLIRSYSDNTYDTVAEARVALGNAIFLMNDPNNYLESNAVSSSRYQFNIAYIPNPDDLDSAVEFAVTKSFLNVTREEAIAELQAALFTPEHILEVRKFGPVQASPPVEQEGFTPTSRNGFLRLRLGARDFLHSRFPTALSVQSSALAMIAQLQGAEAIAKLQEPLPEGFKITIPPPVFDAVYRHNDDPRVTSTGHEINNGSAIDFFSEIANYTLELPNEPFTPLLASLSIDYRAVSSKFETEAFHLYPFEASNLRELNLEPEANEVQPTFLPNFSDGGDDGEQVEKEGTLYIGLDQLSVGNTLSLLFQVAEATANPDLPSAVPAWHFLRNNEWIPLEPDSAVLSDQTRGLTVSGVIQIVIPRSINRNNTILPADYYWLKVSVPQYSAATSQTRAIVPQAVLATFVPQEGNDLERLVNPLSAESISELVAEDPAVKSIAQPYASFGGRPPEKENRYYTRVSERLRHKGRAITLFDYEALLLEAFPVIYRLKCINHTLGRRGQPTDTEVAPGHLTIAVIPDLRQQPFANQLEPKFSVGTLRGMEEYIRRHTSPFVRLQVLNPRYQQIHIEGRIKFRVGKSPRFYRDKLIGEVTDFLSPWASGAQDRISFGGKIFKSYILDFIERRDYVDYITDFVMKDEQGHEVDEISARSARSVLVSGTHIFKIIE